MKRLSAVRLSLVTALALAVAPLAFAGGQLKPGTKGPKPATTRVSGFIKGAPAGKTFVLAGRGASTTVDASKAKIRVNGKFSSWDAVKAGTQATATGMMSGGKLMATDVDLHPRGNPKPGGKMPGGKKPGTT